MTPKVIWQIVKDAAGRAGIEKLAPHDLRRTFQALFGHLTMRPPSPHNPLRQIINRQIHRFRKREPAGAGP